MEHKNLAKTFKTENSATEGFVSSGMKQKRSKTRDMKWHWLREKEVLKHLRVYWDIGMNNDSDYFTKHHPPIHHRKTQPRYIHTLNLVREIPQTIIL